MENNIKKISKQNSVRLVGYLKENNLEKITNVRGDEVIRGSMTVAIDDVSSHKVQFYVVSKTKTGEDSKDFANLSKLLPENTVTIASFLQDNPDADFKTAANAASKVWVVARLDEYATKINDQKIRSLVTLKGFRAGLKSANDKVPFAPTAEFTTDIYINNIIPEVNAESRQETGRLIVEGLIPVYDGSVHKIDFVAPVEDNIATYIKNNYKITDTVNITGDLINIQKRIASTQDENSFFGRGSGPQYETKFIRERIIRGGATHPIHQGEDGCFLSDKIKEGLAARELKMVENGKRANGASGHMANSTATTTSAKKDIKEDKEDLDF